MRKLFSLIAAVLFAGSMMAAETVVFSEQGYENGQAIETYAGTEFTITFDKGTNNNAPKYYNTGAAIRCYGGNSFTVTSEKDITKIELAFAEGEGTNAILTDVEAYADGVWAGKAKAIKFTIDGTSGHRRIASVAVTFDGEGGEEEDPDEIVIYDWRGKIGSTILGAAGVSESTVKIHENTDEYPAIKFANSYVYAEGKYIAIKPAEGGFKAGDVLYVAAVISNDATDGSKYAQVDVFAADTETNLFRGEPVVNGKKSADDPVTEKFVLESDQDSLFIGRYGNTNLFVLTLIVGRPETEPQPVMDYYVVGTMTDWTANAAYKLAANPAAEGEFMGEFAFKANDGFKVAYSDGKTIANDAWFPDGMENEYKITEDGDYAVYFRPDGQGGEGWHYGFIYVAKKEAPVVDTITCAKAAEDALAGETYETYVKGYVTEIAYAWKDGSMSFWMADEKDGGKVFEAYKCVIEKEEDAVRVGDLVKAHGTLTKYNTTPELAAGCTVEILERAPEVVPQNLGEKTIAEFLELKNRVDTCILTGTVKNIVMDTQDPTKPNIYGNFDLEDATASVYVYGLLTPEGEAKKFPEMGIVEGDVIIIKALYNEYNNTPQVKNAILVRKKGQGLDNTDAEVKVEKFFRNGQLIIRKNGVEYNAQGAIVR